MALNQVGFGAPQGAGNPFGVIQDAVNDVVSSRRAKKKQQGDLNNRLEMMAVSHALQSSRDQRKFGHERAMQTERLGHQRDIATLQGAIKIREGQSSRRHERSMAKLSQGHELAKQNAAFAGITQLGKGKRVSSFSMGQNGEMNVSYNKPTRRRTTAPRATGGTSQAPAPTGTPSRSVETPTPPAPTTQVAPVIRDKKTGRAMRNPAYTSPAPTSSTPKAAPKAARRPRGK